MLRLYFEFFRVGLFSVGGGLATIPFLTDLGTRTGWFTPAELANMVAVSESTPGPMGVNMATYVGFETNGPMGCVIATLGLITPSIIIILVIARFLQKFRQSRTVDAVFYGLRPHRLGGLSVGGQGEPAVLAGAPSRAGRSLHPSVQLEVHRTVRPGLSRPQCPQAEKAPPHIIHRLWRAGGHFIPFLVVFQKKVLRAFSAPEDFLQDKSSINS